MILDLYVQNALLIKKVVCYYYLYMLDYFVLADIIKCLKRLKCLMGLKQLRERKKNGRRRHRTPSFLEADLARVEI